MKRVGSMERLGNGALTEVDAKVGEVCVHEIRNQWGGKQWRVLHFPEGGSSFDIIALCAADWIAEAVAKAARKKK